MVPKLAIVGPLKADSVGATFATVMAFVPAARAVPSSSIRSTVIVGVVGPLTYVCVTIWPVGLPVTGPVSRRPPVNRVAGHRVGPRIGHGAQGQAVDRPFVDRGIACQRDRGGHVIDGDGLRAGHQERAIFIGHVHRDGAAHGAIGIGVANDLAIGIAGDRPGIDAISPVNGVARDRVGPRIGPPKVRL